MKILMGLMVIDRPQTTERCIKHILNHTDRSQFIWVVIDNASNAETQEMLKKYEKDFDLVVHNSFNVGTAFGVNQYMQYRDMEQHVLNVNADCFILTEDWLDYMLYVEKNVPDAGTISGRRPTFWYDDPSRMEIFKNHVEVQGLNNNLLFIEWPKDNHIIFPWTLILSKVIDQIGYMNEVTCVDDFDYIERITALHLRNVYIPDVVILQPQDEEQHHPQYKGNGELIRSHWQENLNLIEAYRAGRDLYCGNRFIMLDKGNEEYQRRSNENWRFFETYGN